MVFQPSSSVLKTSNLEVSSHQSENQNLPATPSQFDVVQSHYPRSDTVEQLLSTSHQPPLSSATSNDEIQDLLVALLEEVCNLKEALLNPDVLDNKHNTNAEEEKMEMPEEKVVEKPSKVKKVQTIDFTSCF